MTKKFQENSIFSKVNFEKYWTDGSQLSSIFFPDIGFVSGFYQTSWGEAGRPAANRSSESDRFR